MEQEREKRREGRGKMGRRIKEEREKIMRRRTKKIAGGEIDRREELRGEEEKAGRGKVGGGKREKEEKNEREREKYQGGIGITKKRRRRDA